MKASGYIKAKGLPSLAHVARMVNKPQQTINNWYRDNFALFEIVVLGCAAKEKTRKPPSIESIVGCSCGWEGVVGHLINNNCPSCGKSFNSWPFRRVLPDTEIELRDKFALMSVERYRRAYKDAGHLVEIEFLWEVAYADADAMMEARQKHLDKLYIELDKEVSLVVTGHQVQGTECEK